MINKYPKINIIILQYNNSVDTLDCLWSLRHVNYSQFDVVIVDNASKEEEIAKIREYAKDNVDRFDTHLIENSVNLGYAGGNNIGIEYALNKNRADYILILNNDTVVSPEILEELVNFAEENKEYGIIGPKMNVYRRGPGEDKIWFSGAEVQFLNTNVKHKVNPNNKTGETGFIPGAGIFIRKDVIEKVGYLDEDYFLYYEDMDFSIRVKQAGFKIGYVSDAVIWHKISGSVSALPDKDRLRYIFRNTLVLANRFGDWKTKLKIVPWMLYIGGKQLVKILFVPKTREVSKSILSAFGDFIKNRIGDFHHPKIKIGIESSDLEDSRYGIGKTLIRLAQYLHKNEEIRNNYAFYLYFKGKIPNDPALNHPIFRKRHLRIPKVPTSFNVFYHIYLPVAYWTHRLNACLFFAYMLPAFFKGKSIVMLTNDVIYEIKNKDLPFRYRLGYGLFSWWAAKRADKILTLSNHAKTVIAKSYKIDPDKIFVSQLGIDKTFDERPDITDINDTKRKLGIDRFFITFVGQAFPRRRLKETLLAFKKIKQRNDGLQFLFVGIDKYPDSSLQDLIKEINNEFNDAVVYHHRLESDDLRSIYAGTKLIAYISTSEAQGLPPMEALKYGTPALLKDYGLSRELFDDMAFFIKDETDINEIADNMKQALDEESPLRKKIKQGGKSIADRYTWEGFVKNLLNEIRQIT